MKVSVIIVNYNGMAHIDTCLRSVLAQTYGNFEVILVDNDSNDGSLEYARATFTDRISVIANKSNLGYAGGINSALPHARGEYIAPLNIDTEVGPEWLAVMATFMDSNQSVGAVTPKILLFDDRKRINARGLNIHISGLSFCRQLNREDDGAVSPERVTGISGCSYLIRRQILEEMGGAPEDYMMSNDDVIISWLLNLMGLELYCLPRAIVYHKYTLKMTPDKLFRLEGSRQELLLASLRPLTLLIIFPALLAIELLIIIYCLAKGRGYFKAKFSSLASVWHRREEWRKTRQCYQQLRRISDLALLRRLCWNLDWGQLFQITH